MKKANKITSAVLAVGLTVSIPFGAFAAPIPKESTPCYATDEAICITENIVSGILDNVQNGMGYADARNRANNLIRNAVLAHQTNGYGFAILSEIADNAVFQYRDMYLRPGYYESIEAEIETLIADIIMEVKNGKGYTEALKEAYIRIFQTANPSFSPDEQFSIDNCYRDIPAMDCAYFTVARKLLLNAKEEVQ